MVLFRRVLPPPGAPPGTVANQSAAASTLDVAIYDAGNLEEQTEASWPSNLFAGRQGRTAWIDVRGLADEQLVRSIGSEIDLHTLAVSDVLNVGQRPKIDTYDAVLFIVLRSISIDGQGALHWEQVAIAMGRDSVATFQEAPEDCLAPVRRRLRDGRQRLRSGGVDYLTCALIDAVVDNY